MLFATVNVCVPLF